ncbi:hypothetical protein GALMADRAFT_264524 [Galerina marginata CBS 339.88]|uniref:F-box domain-containing protein n=1 Tax=Galerina marginata (strain CBS 339.88) TaxID=685588 RepID=A0A067TBI0_GALM3|nr:hypothetical protein GALMADRAFT_264524 [Galerina marginata CBS 339.88]
MASATARTRRPKVSAMTRVAVNRTERKLPFEIWSLICALLTQNDLTHIARVSSTLLRVCRPILYRSVILRNNSPNLQLQLRVVGEHAAGIRQLTIFTTWVPRNPHAPSVTWLDFNILSRFASLRALTFIGSPFATHEEQTKFTTILKHASRLLKSFTYVPHGHTTFPSPFFELSGLESVSWHTYLADSASAPEHQLLSLLSASAHTLCHLSFHNCPGYPAIRNQNQGAHDTWDVFMSLHFPRLVSLSLGLMYPSSIPRRHKDTRTSLTRFLLAHPTLRHLALANSSHSEDHYEGISGNGKLIKSTFLLALRSFETHPANLTIMIKQKVRSLQELTNLSILFHCGPSNGAFEALLVALQGSAGFSSVSHLKLQFSSDRPQDSHIITPLIIQWVQRLSAHCPAVLAFSGDLGPILSPWYLAQALHPYKLLETIDLPRTILMSPGGPVSANDFVPIANACSTLSKVVIKTTQNSTAKYVLSRNDQGILCAITVTPMG